MEHFVAGQNKARFVSVWCPRRSRKETMKIRLGRGVGGANEALIDPYIKVRGHWELELTHEHPDFYPAANVCRLSCAQVRDRFGLDENSRMRVVQTYI